MPWINHLRVPSFISGVLLIIAFPLIAQLKHSYYFAVAGVSETAYLTHWLLVTAFLFVASAVIYLMPRDPGPAAPKLRRLRQSGEGWVPRTSRPGSSPVGIPSSKVTVPRLIVQRYPCDS